MVWHDEHAFLTQPQSLALHRSGDHLKGLACAHLMCKQRIAAIENVRHGVSLMLPQGDLRVHAHKGDVLSIVFTGTDGVKLLVVLADQRLPPYCVLPNPLPKSILDGLLLLLRQRGFLLVEHTALLAVCILHGIIDAHIPQIQGIFQNSIGAGPLGAVGDIGSDIAGGNRTLARDIPFCGVG